MRKSNILLILIDDLRFDEFGAGVHPYMKTPYTDRIAHEGAIFERAFHTTPICSPNRASILTGQEYVGSKAHYASDSCDSWGRSAVITVIAERHR
jgi:arylsulfatase A-like enzyme